MFCVQIMYQIFNDNQLTKNNVFFDNDNLNKNTCRFLINIHIVFIKKYNWQKLLQIYL